MAGAFTSIPPGMAAITTLHRNEATTAASSGLQALTTLHVSSPTHLASSVASSLSSLASSTISSLASSSSTHAPTTTTSHATSSTSASASASCVSAVPGKYGYVPVGACNSNYNYDPNFLAAVITTVIFGVLLILHIIMAISHRKSYAWVIIMAAAWEVAAFVMKALGAHNQQSTILALLSQIFFFLAPLWINAFCYMTFARLAWFYMPQKTIFGVYTFSLSKIFVTFDIISFLVQLGGVSMTSPGASSNTIKLGLDIYQIGIGIQELYILIFTGLIITFHRRMLAHDRSALPLNTNKKSWKPVTYTLYLVLTLITIRIIYRLIEFARGINENNPLPFHEIYSYVLDALPMAIALALFVIVHPGRYLQGPGSSLPSRKEKKQIKREHKAEKRAEKGEKTQPRMPTFSLTNPFGQTGQSYEAVPRGGPGGYHPTEDEEEERLVGAEHA